MCAFFSFHRRVGNISNMNNSNMNNSNMNKKKIDTIDTIHVNSHQWIFLNKMFKKTYSGN